MDRVEAQEERRRRMRETVIARGFVRTADLAEEFGISLMTAHRDLDALQAQGWLRKVRGGATGLPSAQFHGSVAERMATMAQTKQQLARAAATLLVPGQSVLLDDSTTCLLLAHQAAEHTPLTVLTNSLPAITTLAKEPGISLITLGGAYFPAYDAFMGPHTADAVRAFRADVLFMSTTAVTNGRCYHTSPETVQVKRAMMESAGRRILVADHTKFAKGGLYALAPLTDFDLLIVDDGLPAEHLRQIRAAGTEVLVVPGRP
ncbi:MULTISPECIES: DeoR/GlpR family DNA-binding transcription regulator [Streptomyces]|uniref:DeoR/GlpR family DNA-binding transcription regulator n=1 Tax=Streptomyces TaxID=1883 RepID=UPI0005259442|nr:MULTISPECIES: DeoR/GlpR family DNA-binding transcription regulator [Streptomyces]ARH94227.1 DeoR family transcriptional regulator [Streptomyces sp. MOE7]MDC7335916.1 DeoR/GlpR family DNA-binding transcription regulator [Streptomyces lydicus]UEG94829.1 DeoR/GlpR family DNA-binding transcription regulator [Streptomyces lydicus]